MKNKIALSLLVSTAFSSAALAAPPGAVPTPVEAGRLQDRFSQEKPQLQITDDVLIKDSQESPDAQNAGDISFTLNSLTVEGNTIFTNGEIEEIYKDKIGKTVTLAEIYAVRDEITKLYREKGYILSRAIIPAQKLGKGKADFKIRIIEGYINDVSVQGEFKGDRSILDNYISKIKKSGPINSNDLERYLLLINDLAGTKANAVLRPAQGKDKVGASDVIITTDHDYINGLLSVDNSGTKFIGRHLISAEANVNSALGLSEKLTVRGIVAADTDELKFGDVSLQMPIGYEGTKAKILAGKTKTRPGNSIRTTLDLEGETELLEFTVTHPFLRTRKENFTARGVFALKETDTDIGALDLYEDKTRTFTLGGTYDLADSWKGVNLIDLSATQGFDIFGASGDGDPQSRANGKTVFTKFNFEASRLQSVWDRFGILFATSGQYSLDPLLASEEFGIGGVDFGRGYDFSEITGEHGIAGKVELQYGFDVDSQWLNGYQLYAFYDAGVVWQRDEVPGEIGRSSLTSAGLGTRFNLFNSAAGFVELAKPLTRPIFSEGDKDTQVNFGLSYIF